MKKADKTKELLSELNEVSKDVSKKLETSVTQYNAVVKQNRSLQQELQAAKADNKKYRELYRTFFNIDNQECWNAAFLKAETGKYRDALEKIKALVFKRFGLGICTQYSSVFEEIQKIAETALKAGDSNE